MRSDKEQSDAVSNNICPEHFLPDSRILIVDDNSEHLDNVAEMLLGLGYEVITATCASDALSIVQQQKDEIHLVLMAFHLLDMARSCPIKKIREGSKMPFFVMPSDDTEFSLVGMLSAWGKFFSQTLVVIADLEALWQFGTLKKNTEKLASEGACGFLGNQPRQGKRKGKEHLSTDEIGENTELPAPKKRLVWNDELIKRLLATLDMPEAEKERTLSSLQEEDAVPEDKVCILSYLEEDALLDSRACILSDLQLGSPPLSGTSNYAENLIPYMDQLFVIYEPDSSSNLMKDSSSSLPMHYLSPEQLISKAISSGYDSSEFILPVFVHPTSSGKLRIYGHWKAFAGFGQVKNVKGGEISMGHVNLSSRDNSGDRNEMQPQDNDLQLRIPPQSVVNDMQPQVPQQQTANENVNLSNGENPGSRNEIPSPSSQIDGIQGCTPLPLLLPTHPMMLPIEGNASETNAGESDDLDDFPTGPSEFRDEDLEHWLSTL